MWFRVSWVRAPLPTPDLLVAKGRSVRSGLFHLSASILGCSQVVRHGTLTPAFAGSSPAIPATSEQSPLGLRFRLRRKLHPLPCSSFPHATRGAGLARGPQGQFHFDSLAQLVEQRPFKAKVRGSSPRRVTTTRAPSIGRGPCCAIRGREPRKG